MTTTLADRLPANRHPARSSKRLSQESLDLKQAYTDLLLREITTLATEGIVRRAWERYANHGQVGSTIS
jgi:hypothetical protein